MPPLHLLVIEDNPDDFRLMTRHLEKHGLEARCTRISGLEELQQALAVEDCDAVLSGYDVPKLDFRKTASLLQARHEDLPLILVSGSVGEERAAELLQLGVWDFVCKDNLARLVPALERSLREALDRRARRQAHAALVASETRYRRLFESSKDGLLILDAVTGRIQDLNPHLAELLGKPREELLDQPVWQTPGLSEIIANEGDVPGRRPREVAR